MEKLQKIPITNDDESITYEDIKKVTFDDFESYLKRGCSIVQCVRGTYYYQMETEMDQNGMEKLIAMVHGMLFMIEHDEVDSEQAYGTMCDIREFETGEYDDLFNEEDLKALKEDIHIVKDYVENHPESLN